MTSEIITTGRLMLRPLRMADVDDVLEYASDPEWSRYLIALPASAYTRRDAEGFVAGQLQLDRELQPTWAIELESRVVGSLNVRFFHEHRIAELGYGLAARVWGRGLAVEAARAVVGECFAAYPQLMRFRAIADARNERSLRVMDKLGMKREALLRSDRLFRGELVDQVVCGLLRSEWAG